MLILIAHFIPVIVLKEKLLAQLNSERMAKFVAMSSRDFRNGWKAYNKKVIESFALI